MPVIFKFIFIYLHFQSSLLTSGAITLTGLGESERRRITVGIDFGDSAQTSTWNVQWANGEKTAKFEVQVK